MSKLFYTTALSLLTSSAMAMVQTSDDTITSGLESLVITEPKPHTMSTIAPDISLTSLDEIRSAIDAEYIKATEALSS